MDNRLIYNKVSQIINDGSAIAIDPNLNGVQAIGKIGNDFIIHNEVIDVIEKEVVSNTKKNKRRRNKKFFNDLGGVYPMLYKNRSTISDMFSVTQVRRSVCRGVIPELSYKEASSHELCVFLISMFFLNHRGQRTQRQTVKFQNKAVSKTTLKEIDINADSIFEPIRQSNTNSKAGVEIKFINQQDNREYYIDLLKTLGVENREELADKIFVFNSQKVRNISKRGPCSYISGEKRGDKYNPYQEIRVAHESLNISMEHRNMREDDFSSSLLKNINKSDFIKVIIKSLGLKPSLEDGKIIFSKGSTTLSISQLAKIYELCIESHECGAFIQKSDLPIKISDKVYDNFISTQESFFEEHGSKISNVSDIFAKEYVDTLLSTEINTPSYIITKIVLDKYETGGINKYKILKGEHVESVNKENSFLLKNLPSGIVKKAFIEKKINKEYLDTSFKLKWTDPNVQIKTQSLKRLLLDYIFGSKRSITSKEFYKRVNNIQKTDFIIESTKQKRDITETILENEINYIIKNIAKQQNYGDGILARLLYESNGYCVYSGEILSGSDIEKEHIVPKSWSTKYGNNLINLVATTKELNKDKGNNLPLMVADWNEKNTKANTKKVLKNRANEIYNEVIEYIQSGKSEKITPTSDEKYVNIEVGDKKLKKLKKEKIEILLKDYFKKKIAVLWLKASKSELEESFASNALSNISHTTSAYVDLLVDVFGLNKQKKIKTSPRGFSFIGTFRGKGVGIDIPKDREWRYHQLQDCFLLLYLYQRKTLFSNYNGSNKYLLNDRGYFINYMKKIGAYGDDKKITQDELNDINKVFTELEKFNPTFKKTRAFVKRKNQSGGNVFGIRYTQHKETIRTTTKDGIKIRNKKDRFIICDTTKKVTGGLVKHDDSNILKFYDNKGNFVVDVVQRDGKFFTTDFNQEVVKQKPTGEQNRFIGSPTKTGKRIYKDSTKHAVSSAVIGDDGKMTLMFNLDLVGKAGKLKNKPNGLIINKGDIVELDDYEHNKMAISGKYKVVAMDGNNNRIKIRHVNCVVTKKQDLSLGSKTIINEIKKKKIKLNPSN